MDRTQIRLALTYLQQQIYANASAKGFWKDFELRNMGESIALMHSELSEALEAIRSGNPPDKHCPQHSSLEVELADCIIRILDFAQGFDLDVASALLAKMEFNKGRPPKHGKEF